MALVVAHLPPMKRAGQTLLWCVTGFGIATILFGLSKTFWLSLGLLFFIGAFDSVSVIIRGSIVQLVTPDEMRGRVSAVNNIFIGTSNEFGALESGLTAALFGPVISVVAGGIGTILVVLGVALRWPETRKIGALDKDLALGTGEYFACDLESRRTNVTNAASELKGAVQRNHPVRGATVLVVAHVGAIEIEVFGTAGIRLRWWTL